MYTGKIEVSRFSSGLLDATSSSTDGAYDMRMHRFGQRDIGLHIDENLGLEAGAVALLAQKACIGPVNSTATIL